LYYICSTTHRFRCLSVRPFQFSPSL